VFVVIDLYLLRQAIGLRGLAEQYQDGSSTEKLSDHDFFILGLSKDSAQYTQRIVIINHIFRRTVKYGNG
jgi:hypothetical protein